MTAPDRAALETACQVLASRDAALAKACKTVGPPDWRAARADYKALCRIIVHQQLSTRAAATIWARLQARYDTMIPQAVLDDDKDNLRACGLSHAKVTYLKSIAEALQTGMLRLDTLCTQPVDEARKALLAVKGIGPWSAEIFLMNAAGHMDAFPASDLGLIEAYRQLSNARMRHDVKAFTALAENWRPYRGVAAHLLWQWLNTMRDRQVP